MKHPTQRFRYATTASLVLTALLAVGCSSDSSGDDNPTTSPETPVTPEPGKQIPQLSEAVGAKLKGSCADLAGFSYPGAVITLAETVPAGTLKFGNNEMGEHCRVLGKLEERVSPIDNDTYAIGFEMRLPADWSGRYFYQGNGGSDGSVVTAIGEAGSGGVLSPALHKGFAVISSDAGHTGQQNSTFGLDPQARINYGYGAVQKLTPMAKQLITQAYGKGPDRSYIGGNSNGGRHAMVAAARFADEYDGVLASAPGFNLPIAAAGLLWGSQQLNRIATVPGNLASGLNDAERQLITDKLLGQCDSLDGIKDGLIQDVEACRTTFNLFTDVPSCTTATRDGSCLSTAQKTAVDALFQGPVNSKGERLYATAPYHTGLVNSDWPVWKFFLTVPLVAPSVGVMFQVPPEDPATFNPMSFTVAYDYDTDFPKLFDKNATFTESAMEYMTPPNATQLDTLRDRGGKMIVIHGSADGAFSVDGTRDWYDGLMKENQGDASHFARFFIVPGMGHGAGGISTDQYDALAALIDWVEHGKAPERIVAQARGAGNPGGINTALPADWASDRTRPLCPYPLVARYTGNGDTEQAQNFDCAK